MSRITFVSLAALCLTSPAALAQKPVETTSFDIDCSVQMELCYQKALDVHYGKGTMIKDVAGAHKIFTRLCEAKFSKACHAASISISRYSETPDYEKSLHLQKIGCETGTARSCFVLGRSYESPWKDGVQADHDKARYYFNKGCDLGMALACDYAEVEATGHRLK